MKKSFLTISLLLSPVWASAQISDKDLVSCNKIKAESKRMECLKNAMTKDSAKSEEKNKIKDTGPLTLETALPICEEWMAQIRSKRDSVSLNESRSTEDLMVLSWPGDEGKPPTSCLLNKNTKEFVSAESRGYSFTKAQLEASRIESKKFAAAQAKMNAGDYGQFIADAKAMLTRDFKDPSSATYRGLFISKKGMTALCGEINAKNSYGAYVGFRRFYATGKELLNEVEKPKDDYVFSQMYPSMCGTRDVEIQSP